MPPDLLFGATLGPVSVLLMAGLMSPAGYAERLTSVLAAAGFLVFAINLLAAEGASLLWPYAMVIATVSATVVGKYVLGAGQRLVTDEQLYNTGQQDPRSGGQFTTGHLLLIMAASAGLSAAAASFSVDRVAHVPLVGYSLFVAFAIGATGGCASMMGVWLVCGQNLVWQRLVGALAVTGAASALLGGVVWIAVSADQQAELWTMPVIEDLEAIRMVPWRPMLASVVVSSLAALPLYFAGRRWQDWPFD